MNVYLNHVAIYTKDYVWNREFFKNVCGMHIYEEDLSVPGKSKVWFVEGIQINEKPEDGPLGSLLDHICLMVEDVDQFVAEAISAGCSPLAGKSNFFVLPTGIRVEVKKIGSVPER